MKTLTSRMEAVQLPVIPMVGELIRKYPDTISLGQGVVYYDPPPEAMAMLREFYSLPGNHKYKPVQGIATLREAIEAKLQTDNKIEINSANRIVVTAGSNMAFMNAILAITTPGDEIILQRPYYFNHEMAIKMASCDPVLVPTDDNYQLNPFAIAQAITDRTKAVVTISPNNPTGAVYSEEALRQVNQLCGDHGIYHISDEAYEYFTYNGVKHFSPGAFPESSQHTISLYSLSKAYGFASWRIGYMIIPEHLFEAIQKVQDTILICPPVISQYAALGALSTRKDYCQPHINAIASVRQVVLNSLKRLEGLCTIGSADGAFYVFLKVDTQLDAFELVQRLIREHRVAVMPGSAFGIEDGCYLRLAYGALQKETAAEGIERFVAGLNEILQKV
ncbi:MAG: pyridoxal phosphate-dependent aminotransferase [Moorea sp. SIO3I7]|uniref:pyridoxal phosphate-dependent aminotransferase n=1 Tax=unclassified Moorena TaxID=2683338 RepID=UPI0013C0C561|nr:MULTISPECIES: pyridoxal phosphate-dependent aminotransferase [unclassified Moorena]NEN99891.1 pyridoxal phosphate-dependent aminotransferase [Moorena sp. SIO3I7]NEO08510.1 pyridoxal phosphate-dependent aminotransferase [Moorena sp. SIO3I8]NEO17868.1 pyridoxal phosphate-dependent aminotransferase [Moorena sp. SIO4A5]NEP25900.1 pyridoxal phosphate-dependent aminotransferase [Moorena sp. SIO3I6]NEQ59884.1 pyridoxal phosphate-dependent aminotransferase [Moorena sp. SIO4A1]